MPQIRVALNLKLRNFLLQVILRKMNSRPSLSEADRQRLDDLATRFTALRKLNIGYPCNQDFDYSELAPFLAWSANNIGDPFGPSNYRLNTLEFIKQWDSNPEKMAKIHQMMKRGEVTIKQMFDIPTLKKLLEDVA